jgi:nucleoside-diphosphate-sugar epimerase
LDAEVPHGRAPIAHRGVPAEVARDSRQVLSRQRARVNALSKHAIVTGASGFIGRAVVGALAAQGWSVVAAGRRPGVTGAAIRELGWSLGQPLAIDLDTIDVVFHCASATIAAARDFESARRLDLAGTRILIDQCRVASGNRPTPILFVFISSQSASPHARNAYGRSKHEIEQLLTGPHEAIVRPGLVYDDARTGVYGTAIALIRRARVLPKLGGASCIQPIHVADLVTCLTRIAERRLSGTFCLGREAALDFVGFCRRAAARENLRSPIFVPFVGILGERLLGLAAKLGLLASLHERVEGLIALQPMPTAADLARLGIRLRDF